MRCQGCGESVPEGAAFCHRCGAVPGEGAACADCGAALDPGTRRCPECGNDPYRTATTGGAVVAGVGLLAGYYSSPAAFFLVPLGVAVVVAAYRRRENLTATEYSLRH